MYGDIGSFYSSAVPIIANLKTKVEQAPTGIKPCVKSVYDRLHRNIDHYFFGKEFLNIFSPKSLLYCLLDPRFKHLTFAPHTEIEQARQLLTNLHSSIYTHQSIPEKVNETDEKLQLLYGSISNNPVSSSRQMMDSYYREPQADLTVKPIVWWQANKTTYPFLAKLAIKFLSRPGTSVPCEQLWSEAGLIVSDLRSSLDPDTVCMLTFCEHNLRELKKIGKPFIWV